MTDKKTARTTPISSDERLQLIGLSTLSQQYNNAAKDCERAMLAITQEIDRGGKPLAAWDGGLTGDASYDTATPAVQLIDNLLRNLGIEVSDPAPSELEATALARPARSGV